MPRPAETSGFRHAGRSRWPLEAAHSASVQPHSTTGRSPSEGCRGNSMKERTHATLDDSARSNPEQRPFNGLFLALA